VVIMKVTAFRVQGEMQAAHCSEMSILSIWHQTEEQSVLNEAANNNCSNTVESTYAAADLLAPQVEGLCGKEGTREGLEFQPWSILSRPDLGSARHLILSLGVGGKAAGAWSWPFTSN
jgi:hypothetical protein